MHPLIPYFEPPKIPIYGDFAIHGFGILVAIGFVVGARAAMAKARRDGLDPDVINRLVSWLVVSVFVGGHLGHLLFYEPGALRDDPAEIFRVWRGLSSFGGFIASTITAIWFFRREDRRVVQENRRRKERGEPLRARVRLFPYADTVIYGFAIGWFFGRMGCFVAHDHPGTETSFWLGVYGMCPPMGKDLNVACHDLGMYEGLFALAVFGAFRLLDRRPRFPGFFLALMLLLYGPYRFVSDFFRHPDTDTRYFGLTPAQYGSLVLLALGIWVWRRQRGAPPVRPVARAGRGAEAEAEAG